MDWTAGSRVNCFLYYKAVKLAGNGSRVRHEFDPIFWYLRPSWVHLSIPHVPWSIYTTHSLTLWRGFFFFVCRGWLDQFFPKNRKNYWFFLSLLLFHRYDLQICITGSGWWFFMIRHPEDEESHGLSFSFRSYDYLWLCIIAYASD